MKARLLFPCLFLVGGLVFSVASVILGANGWPIERLWLYLLAGTMLMLLVGNRSFARALLAPPTGMSGQPLAPLGTPAHPGTLTRMALAPWRRSPRGRRTASLFFNAAIPAWGYSAYWYEENNHIQTFGVTPKLILESDIFGMDNRLISGIDYYGYKDQITSQRLISNARCIIARILFPELRVKENLCHR